MGIVVTMMLTKLDVYDGNIFSMDDDYFICVKEGLTMLYFYADDLKSQCHTILTDVKQNSDDVTLYVYNKMVYGILYNNVYYQSNQVLI
jgi:hypothetical protein